jgi:hypothetical protein
VRSIPQTRPRAGPHGTTDHGYATAEAAVALPALLLVLALAVGVVVSVGAQLRCVDAARVAARVATRGDSDSAAEQAAARIAPGGAQVRVVHRGSDIEVDVSADVRPFGSALRLFPAVHVSARAVAEVEPP